MHIIIVGGGVVGHSLAEQLLREKHELSMVEQDKGLCRSLAEKLDVQIVSGSGSSPAVLKTAGLDSADMVLAVTPNDEVNLIVCAVADQYGVKRRIARLRRRDFSEAGKLVDLKKLGVTSVIHPEKALVDQLLQFVLTPHALESANFESGRMLLRGYRVTENMELAGKKPKDIRPAIAPDVVLFVALVRGGTGMIPDGETVIQPGDIVFTLFPRESLARFLKLVGVEKRSGRRIIMTGDSYTTIALAEALDPSDDFQVTFVDPNLEHARQAAAEFHHIEVIHGDCTQEDILREVNVSGASFFIAVSDASDYNMFSALLAKAEGAHETIATTTESRHDKLFYSIGIDHVINPRLTTAREILEIIHRGHIGAVVRLSDVDIEAVRFTVEPESDVAGMKIKRIAGRLRKGSIIGVIVREEGMLLPDGETTLEVNDHVIVITYHGNLPAVSKLFKPRRSRKRS